MFIAIRGSIVLKLPIGRKTWRDARRKHPRETRAWAHCRSRLARDYSSGILPGSYSASPIKNPLRCIYNIASLAALGIHPAPFCAAFTRGSTTFRLPSKSFTRDPRVRQKPRAAADALPGAKNMAPLQGASTDGRRSRLARDYSSGILPG